ncbi:hypothetical protein ACVIGA_005087 [Bradyrhizobium sp. USDA 3240]
MARVRTVTAVSANQIQLPAPFKEQLVVVAQGDVPTTGWSHIRLSPRYYVAPPADGIWDFDFIGDEPTGGVGQVILPVAAEIIAAHPAWCTGVRVHSATNSITAKVRPVTTTALAAVNAQAALAPGHVIHRQIIASFDDSFQPTGRTKFDPWPHLEMKKLHHELELVVEGPDEQKIKDCVARAAAAGLIAAIIAAFATGGAAMPAAISAFLAALQTCLGNNFIARIDNHSHWEYWWT